MGGNVLVGPLLRLPHFPRYILPHSHAIPFPSSQLDIIPRQTGYTLYLKKVLYAPLYEEISFNLDPKLKQFYFSLQLSLGPNK